MVAQGQQMEGQRLLPQRAFGVPIVDADAPLGLTQLIELDDLLCVEDRQVAG
jgi:hypothetical protein